jgi:hypothetical protein
VCVRAAQVVKVRPGVCTCMYKSCAGSESQTRCLDSVCVRGAQEVKVRTDVWACMNESCVSSENQLRCMNTYACKLGKE